MEVLIVDDDNVFRKSVSQALERRGHSVTSAGAGTEAMRMAADARFDVAFVDMKMPGMSGIELVQELRHIQPGLRTVILTGHGSIPGAVEAIKTGAWHYLTKPCEVDNMEAVIRRAYKEAAPAPIALDSSGPAYHGMAGRSRALRGVIAAIKSIKDSPFPALITGESGTGKELASRAVHFDGVRKTNPFVAINCASLKPELLENELFGHVKGAFTGALVNKEGLLKVADHGTIFIDEIGDMNMTVQASLLRFLEGGRFRPLGSTAEIQVDVRVVAAINKDIEEEVRHKRFRHDLYYRLNVCRIDLPPLRDRMEDVPVLVRHFLHASGLAGGPAVDIAPAAIDMLSAYDWPGNVRELMNVLSRAVLLCNESVITRGLIASILPSSGAKSSAALSSLEEIEKRHLHESIRFNGWNVSRTAVCLGIDRRTLQRKMRRYRIARPEA